MNPEVVAAIKVVLDSLAEFTYGPIEGAPFVGMVTLSPEQYRALAEAAHSQ